MFFIPHVCAVPQDELTHRQFVVESFDLDNQAVLTGHQFVLQLGHFSLVSRLCQVVAQNVDEQIKQDHAGRQQGGGRQTLGEREKG